ncbi:MAG TPA: hypothetical protein VLA09_13845 [Longimicrobiales bacterium]|nr:hypothetical protein [Longimicrobiales bacterium]
MKNRIKAPMLAVLATLALAGCDLLDVDNPNSLVEEDIRQAAVANGVANGSLRLVGRAISSVWQPYLVASDEIYWIGSRDAWFQLDQGFVRNPENEFTDGAFPELGRAVWMAREAVEILQGHVADNPGVDSFAKDLARAHMFYGMILMVTGEIQEDMTFSDKMEDGAPVGPAQMYTVLDDAIAQLSSAITGFSALGEDALETTATALRARAYMSRAIWDELNPTATVGGALSWPQAYADANTVLADVGGSGWQYDLKFSSSSTSCGMCGWINDRKENQIDLSLVTVDDSEDINGIALADPITGEDDLALINRLNQWKGGNYLDSGNQYPPLTVVSERLLELIVAEHELAGGNTGAFETAINNIRALDYDATVAGDGSCSGDDCFVSGGPVTDVAMLQHTRRVNALLMGLRLGDMYRWGLQPQGNPNVSWSPNSEAVLSPGEMLPITIIEVRANCHLNGQGCGG